MTAGRNDMSDSMYTDASQRMSQITVHSGTVYLPGQVPTDTSTRAEG